MPSLALVFVCKQIIPSKCRYDVLSTKVEIRLAKAESIFWKSLEFSKENTVPQKVNASGRLIFLYCILFQHSSGKSLGLCGSP
jgi:hypothetical protein